MNLLVWKMKRNTLAKLLAITGLVFFLGGLFMSYYGFDPDPELVPKLDKYGRQTTEWIPEYSRINSLGTILFYSGPVLVLVGLLTYKADSQKI